MDGPGALPDYGLSPPSAESGLAALERMLGDLEAETRWAEACRAAGVTWPGDDLDLPQLRAVAEHLSLETDLVSVVGRSLLVRINTYEGIRRRLAP